MNTNDSAAFHAVALVAAVRTALGAARRIADRRAGRDASEQEPEADVRRDLEALRAALAEDVVRLRLRAVVGAPDGAAAALAQAFEDRTLLDDLGRTLAVVHQKLLSLYPAVDEATVEEARVLSLEASRRAVAEAYDRGLEAYAERVADLADALAEGPPGGV